MNRTPDFLITLSISITTVKNSTTELSRVRGSPPLIP